MYLPSFNGKCGILFVNFFYWNTWKQLKFVGVVFDCVIYVLQYLHFIFWTFYMKGVKVKKKLLQNKDFLKIFLGLNLELEIN